MNKKFICNTLNCTDLENYIISELEKSQEKAITKSNEFIILAKESIQNVNKEDDKINVLFALLTAFKQEFVTNNHNYLKHYIDESKNYIYESKKENQFSNVANYITSYYNFLNLTDLSIIYRLKRIKQHSYELFLSNKNYENCQFFLEELKIINATKNYEWNFSNLESNIFSFYKNQEDALISLHKKEVEELNEELKDCNYELKEARNNLKTNIEFIEKHYKSSVVFVETYFGDNPYMMIEFYNFLATNNYIDYSFGYFFYCLIKGNKDILYLNKPKNFDIVGHLLFSLKKYLNVPEKEIEVFYQNKFYFGNAQLSNSFYRLKVNKISKYRDDYEKDDKELKIIDAFILKMDKLYNFSISKNKNSTK